MTAFKNSTFPGMLLAALFLLLVASARCQEIQEGISEAAPTDDCNKTSNGARLIFSASANEDGTIDKKVELVGINRTSDDLELQEQTVTSDVEQRNGRNFTVVRARLVFVIPPPPTDIPLPPSNFSLPPKVIPPPPKDGYVQKPTGLYKFYDEDKLPNALQSTCGNDGATAAYPTTEEEATDISQMAVLENGDMVLYLWTGIKIENSTGEYVSEKDGTKVSFGNIVWSQESSGGCIAYVPKTKILQSLHCGAELPFVCKKD